MSLEGKMDNIPYMSYTIRVVVCGIIFYINYLYLIDKFLFNKKFLQFILFNLLLVIFLLGVQTIIHEFFLMMQDRPRPPMMNKLPHKPHIAMRLIWDFSLASLVIGLSVAIKMTMQWYNDSIKMEQIRNRQLEADLKNLRNQLNPHFLFNTLNNIYSLIAIDQVKAQESVHRLSNLLRYVLYENETNYVPIEKELEFTKNYIDLMKLRLGSGVKLNTLIDCKNSNNQIAPLIFITLIENAFKHGIMSGKDSFIDIKILVESNRGVLCIIENSLNEQDKTSPDKSSGIGLVNLNQRLELLYPNKYQLEVKNNNTSYSTLLRIDFT
jgi:sensor histidine kinase YesM